VQTYFYIFLVYSKFSPTIYVDPIVEHQVDLFLTDSYIPYSQKEDEDVTARLYCATNIRLYGWQTDFKRYGLFWALE